MSDLRQYMVSNTFMKAIPKNVALAILKSQFIKTYPDLDPDKTEFIVTELLTDKYYARLGSEWV